MSQRLIPVSVFTLLTIAFAAAIIALILWPSGAPNVAGQDNEDEGPHYKRYRSTLQVSGDC